MKSYGFTLLELLVGLFISSVMILGLLQMISISRYFYRYTSNLIDLNESMVYSIMNLDQVAAFAGHVEKTAQQPWGCYSAPYFKLFVDQNQAIGNCPSLVSAVRAFSYGEKYTGASNLCNYGNMSDPYFWERKSDGNCSSGNPGSTGNTQAYTLVMPRTDPSFLVDFVAKTLTINFQGNNMGTIRDCHGNVVTAATFVSQTYSLSGNVLMCTIGNQARAIANNISNIEISPGEDGNGDGAPERYFRTGHVSHKFVSVRIGLLFQTQDEILTRPQGATFSLGGTSTVGPFNDRRFRRAIRFTLSTKECYPLYRKGCAGVLIRGIDTLGNRRFFTLNQDQIGYIEGPYPYSPATNPVCWCRLFDSGAGLSMDAWVRDTNGVDYQSAPILYRQVSTDATITTPTGRRATCSFQ